MSHPHSEIPEKKVSKCPFLSGGDVTVTRPLVESPQHEVKEVTQVEVKCPEGICLQQLKDIQSDTVRKTGEFMCKDDGLI